MANTYTLISSNVLASSAASVTFSAIPSTYTDLVLRVSNRNTSNSSNYTLSVGGSAGEYSETEIHAEGTSTIGSTRTTNTDPFGTSSYLFTVASADTANAFGVSEIYIPSYTASQNKPVSLVSFRERDSTAHGMSAIAGLFRNNSAITTIVATSAGTSFAATSSFYLYGIKNS
jgi:hypothetical protein